MEYSQKETAVSDSNYQLVVRKGPTPGQIYPLIASSVTIGRDPMTDIPLNDPEVSRRHAQLVETETGYQIQDQGSTNGTYVDDQRLGSEPVDLKPGQKVQLGSGITLIYQRAGEDEAAVATMVDVSSSDADVEPDAPETAEPETDAEPVVPAQAGQLPASPQPETEAPRTRPPSTAGTTPPPEPPPRVVSPDDGGNGRRRNWTIAIIVLLLLCCCCALLVFMWQYGGDLILRELGALP
jgi:hypothetical protein